MITVAVPNKGRLAERSIELLERAGLRAEITSDRALVASLGDDFQAIFVRAADIPEFVADGAAHVGITGADLVAESGRDVETLLDLGFGRCRLAVAVPEKSTVHTPEEVCPGTRVATSFPRLTRAFFDAAGVPVEIAAVSGAAEVAPHLGVAQVIVDLVSSGSTLRVNGLREIATVLESSARVIGKSGESAAPDVDGKITELLAAIESVLRAVEKRYVMANVPRDRLEQVRRVIPGITGPTIVDVLDGGSWVAAHAVVDEARIYQTIARLKALGAVGILVTRIERLMP